MIFTNQPVDLALLPRATALELRPPDAAYRRLLRLWWGLTAAFCLAVVIVLFVVLREWRTPVALAWTGGALAVLFGWWLVVIEQGWPWRGWALREHDIAYRHGWIFRSLQLCPFNRIQNCGISRGPVERRYGLATLVLYTAGADGADLKLRGLRAEEAEQIREYLLNRIHGNADHTPAVAAVAD